MARLVNERRIDVVAASAGLLVILVLAVWLAGLSGDVPPSATRANLAFVLVESLPFVLLWLVAAMGFGRPLRAWLAPETRHRLAIQFSLGVAAMLILDAALGALGLLSLGNGVGAWAVTAIGVALAAHQLVRSRAAQSKGDDLTPRKASFLPWSIWLAAPAIAVLIVAACSAPGWLWSSEFGGYDAMSYHLQLPKEWLHINRIAPLEHNVYSFLPGYAEAAYYHLALLWWPDGSLGFVYSAQLLHASIAIATAIITARFVTTILQKEEGPGCDDLSGLAGAIVLGTPWVIVVGSLAYNEMFETLFLAAALLVVRERDISAYRCCAIVGLLAGAACGAKLTAIGFVVAPVTVLILFSHPKRTWIAGLGIASLAGLLALLPWLVRNGICTGNPFFPFLTRVFGFGHWTAEQVATWRAGHLPDADVSDRFAEMWRQLLRFGIGESPYAPSEPWKPQWSILWWLGAAGGLVGVLSKRHRFDAFVLGVMLVVKDLFWLTLTHLKSRFMLPAVAPAAGIVAIGFDVAFRTLRIRGALRAAIVAVIGLAWSIQPLVIFLEEADGEPAARIGLIDVSTGENFRLEEREALAQVVPSVYVNHMLPPDSRVLLVGDATPLYLTIDVTYQTTWDRGPLSRAMSESDSPEAWVQFLREQNFTHVLVEAPMLERWQKAGWNDPNLTVDRVLGALEAHATLMRTWSDGATRLYALDG